MNLLVMLKLFILDIDPAEISKNRCPELAIVGDVRKTFIQMLKKIRKNKFIIDKKQTKSWLNRIYKWKISYPLTTTNYKFQKLSPQETILNTGILI